jgi:hypothetical protein
LADECAPLAALWFAEYIYKSKARSRNEMGLLRAFLFILKQHERKTAFLTDEK